MGDQIMMEIMENRNISLSQLINSPNFKYICLGAAASFIVKKLVDADYSMKFSADRDAGNFEMSFSPGK